ncbi:alkaline phosphatase family protein [Leucobacter luti]|uniref:alkaline phosphatase family protein n=1 Tax=Leucobacter luti TaxID=340320 RepID=UPI003D07E349
MVPTTGDNGARLAAILPSGLSAMARGIGIDPAEALSGWIGAPRAAAASALDAAQLPPVRSFVMVVVDGLGHANLGARIGHAPNIAAMQRKRIETVCPSTTGAALTTLTTGRLPGAHGLIGYRIMHPEHGLLTTLTDWEGIPNRREWQLCPPLFGAVRDLAAQDLGARAVAIGRPAHASGGLTEAILAGAEYVSGQRIADRFAAASAAVRVGEPLLAYVYVDELDRAAHKEGWQSDAWVRRLEQLDEALGDFLRSLPGDVGVVLTADHGMVDVAEHQRLMLDDHPFVAAGVRDFGGEPRFRSLFLADGVDPGSFAAELAAAEGQRAWVATRDEAIASGMFGPLAPGVAERLGDVLIGAKKQVAYYAASDSPQALDMVGQHGALTEEERGVPLALAGAFAGSGFASAVAKLAAA